MEVKLKIINQQLFLDYAGVLYHLAYTEYTPDADGCTVKMPSLIELLDNLHAGFIDGLGRKEYDKILDGEDEEDDKWYIERQYEIGKLNQIWETGLS
jgi:hypothetical protein